MRVVTDREAFRAAAADAPAGARVPVELGVRVADPFEAYRRARRGDGGDVFLETTGGQSGWGHFATEPVERVTVGPDAVHRDEGSPSLSAIESALAAEHLNRGDCDVQYPCGLFGWLSYDAARELEAIPDTTTDVAYDAAVGRARDLVARVVAGDRSAGNGATTDRLAAFTADCSREEFADRVRTVNQSIREGDTFQANVSQRLSAPATVHPVADSAALCRVNPAPFSVLVVFPGVDLVSASPELLLDVDVDRLLTEPIAGTRPRGESREADAALEEDLLTDGKERAEHAMLVDLERNDLGKVGEYGTVSVDQYRRVDRYAGVMHLVSLVAGRRHRPRFGPGGGVRGDDGQGPGPDHCRRRRLPGPQSLRLGGGRPMTEIVSRGLRHQQRQYAEEAIRPEPILTDTGERTTRRFKGRCSTT